MKERTASKKIKVGIIGTGNIGSDLLTKILRSPVLECGIFTGHNPESKGIARAKKLGVKTSFESIRAIEKSPGLCEIVFDATSAEAHQYNAPILKRLKKFVIDMTPSRIGKMCIPIINLNKSLKEFNINMVSCGGQATIPIAQAIMKINPDTEYIEIVSSISSKSAGIGTRNNIDEYTQTTSEALMYFSGVKKAKAIVNLNPADPPILMHNTIYAKMKNPKIELITEEIKKVVKKIQQYVPGYKLVLEPIFDDGKLTTMIEVVGRGDYLPIYAGNLDIINCAAIAVAEEYARRKLKTKKHEK
ncbi:MAG: acetaldehyde dehydrogenase (acetylating) [Patescibacteria group bacterium]